MSVAVARNRKRREEKYAAGLCIDCGRNPHKATSKRCIGCGVKAGMRQKRYVIRLNSYDVPYERAEMSFEQIGANLNISRERARHIYLRALEKVRRQCKRMGMDPGDMVERGFSMLARAEQWGWGDE